MVTKGLNAKLTNIVIKNLVKPGRYTDGKTRDLHLWVKDIDKRYWMLEGDCIHWTLRGILNRLEQMRRRDTAPRHDNLSE